MLTLNLNKNNCVNQFIPGYPLSPCSPFKPNSPVRPCNPSIPGLPVEKNYLFELLKLKIFDSFNSVLTSILINKELNRSSNQLFKLLTNCFVILSTVEK